MPSGKSIAIGLIVGGVIGGISVLLSTPASGRELTNALQRKKDHLVDSTKILRQDCVQLKNDLEDASKRSWFSIQSFSEEIKESVSDWYKDTEKNRKSIQKELSTIEAAIVDLEKSISPKQTN